MKPSDAELVQQTLGGEREAFGALVERYRDMVYGLCYHHLGDFEDARDMAQEAFVAAFCDLSQLRDPAKFAPWLRQVATHRCQSWLRGRRANTVPLEEAAQETDGGEDALERKAMQLVVRESLSHLSERTRLALTLRYIDGYSCGEIADFLEVPVQTVKSRLRLAKAQMREELMEMVKGTMRQQKLPADFTRKVMAGLYKHEQPIDVTMDVAKDGVVFVYWHLTNNPTVKISGGAKKAMRVTGRKVLFDVCCEEATQRLEQVKVMLETAENVWETGPAEGKAFAGMQTPEGVMQGRREPVYASLSHGWKSLKQALNDAPELRDRLATALSGRVMKLAAFTDELAPMEMPGEKMKKEVWRFFSFGGSVKGIMFGGAGGAEFSVSLPACQTLVVVAQGGHVVLSNVEADAIIINPDGELRLTAQHLKGNLHAFGTTPDDIADVAATFISAIPTAWVKEEAGVARWWSARTRSIPA